MSAFIVDPYHIRYLNTYAAHHNVRTPDHKGGPMDGASMTHDEAATMLWNQNVRSVAYRYPDSGDDLPGMIGFTSELPDHTLWIHLPWNHLDFPPGKVLAALACLEYQSCETPDYRETQAFDYLEAIRRDAIRRVDGYDGTWEIQAPAHATEEA